MVDFASRWSLTIIRSGVGLLLHPQQENIWSKPSGWDSLPNNEAEYEAILSGLDLAWLYPSPSSGTPYNDSPSGRSKKSDELKMARRRLGRQAASLPIKEAILLPIYVQPTLPSQKPPLATPLRKPSRRQEWTNDIIIPPDRHSARGSQAGTQDPGASRPFH
ncbi:hypothetical protein CK203_063637 [Vitis vinifera]|uniref:RNase H type-1 domain-containing protein n=1 Tax=Vitis vinifera TaxID=29760 RepID=A0A438G4U7_VITVI|nr:hypothetical protein CK203_063637 [Vitis vinifera]